MCTTGPAAIDVTFREETATVLICGELDLTTMAFLTEQLTLIAPRTPRRLVFDLSRASFVDCGSARVIAGAGQLLPDRPRAVIRHARPSVRRVFELSGLDSLCELEDSLGAGRNLGGACR
jgi:anti-anti-sigma factor